MLNERHYWCCSLEANETSSSPSTGFATTRAAVNVNPVMLVSFILSQWESAWWRPSWSCSVLVVRVWKLRAMVCTSVDSGIHTCREELVRRLAVNILLPSYTFQPGAD